MTDLNRIKKLINKEDKYALPHDILERVHADISKYYEYANKRDEVSQRLADFDYGAVATVRYDRIATSPTNNISRPTERYGCVIPDAIREIERAEAKVMAIDRGINRAATTATRTNPIRLREDLFKNIVEKVNREEFARDTKTFSKYRKRAFYFIAEELGYVEGDYNKGV